MFAGGIMKTRQVKIMRGIPGSGKSTYAQKLASEAGKNNWALSPETMVIPAICSADDFFIDSTTMLYKFEAKYLGKAHNRCMLNYLQYLQGGWNFVVVDNTNINIEDIAPYVAVGEALDYDVEIIQINADVEQAAARNIHGVSRYKVMEMYHRLSETPLPRRWKLTSINP